WRVTVRQRWDRPKATLGQQASCGGADRVQRREGGWRPGKPRGGGDVLRGGGGGGPPTVGVVAGGERRGGGGPRRARGRRRGGVCLGEEGVRVGKVGIMEWIETLGETLCIAGQRFAGLGPFRVIDHFPQEGCSTDPCHDVVGLLSDEWFGVVVRLNSSIYTARCWLGRCGGYFLLRRQRYAVTRRISVAGFAS